ncbi:mitochondrial import inner membrane translocase subunit TIM44-2, partial [Carica papaya]|uniref:mitochondrial import inner membrane translocase subunit TIM44-2 n=1 Tax=Carica papaya TaxID=3649 RepID=UPI000B8D079F
MLFSRGFSRISSRIPRKTSLVAYRLLVAPRPYLPSNQTYNLIDSTSKGADTRLQFLSTNGYSGIRQYSVFNEFSQKVTGEADRNPEFQQSVKELKDKAEELKGLKDDLRIRTKQTTERLYKQVDGVWTEAEAAAKKVSASVKEKISAAGEEVKETFGIGKESAGAAGTSTTHNADVKDAGKASFWEEKQQHSAFTNSAEAEFSGPAGTTNAHGADWKDGGKASSGEEKEQKSETTDAPETLFGKFKSSISSPKVSMAFQKLKEGKVIDLAKKGYDIVKDELSGSPSRRKHLEHNPSQSTVERSTRTDVVVVPSKEPKWRKKWESLKQKMQGHPMFKRISGLSEPVVNKSQEIAEDMRERWETSDNPIVHKIQDINETIFQETDAAASYKEIRRRDPTFSLPDFVAEVQEAIKPVLTAYMKGDVETLKKYCSSEVMERCKAEHAAYQGHGIFFDNKILHISEVEVRETKMMGTSPIIIVGFQTQQIYCVRDRNGAITEGGKDTIHTVYYAWAMQQ